MDSDRFEDSPVVSQNALSRARKFRAVSSSEDEVWNTELLFRFTKLGLIQVYLKNVLDLSCVKVPSELFFKNKILPKGKIMPAPMQNCALLCKFNLSEKEVFKSLNLFKQ